MLTVLSTLGPHRLDAGRCTVTSRFRCRSFDRRYVVGALSTGRCLPAVAPRVLIMGDEVRTRSFSPDNHFTLLQVTALRITRKSTRPRASDRPWLTPYNARLDSVSRLIGVVATKKDAAAEMEQPRARHQTSVFSGEWGWMSQNKPAHPAVGENCS